MSRKILFFGDSSQETNAPLKAILGKPGSLGFLLTKFLEETRVALRKEVVNLSSQKRIGLPDFQSLECLVRDHADRHPALHLLEVVLVQLTYFIHAFEANANLPYPQSHDTIFVGICGGQLAATAVSIARSVHGLIPLAVKATVLAFRAGLLADSIAKSIEAGLKERESWTLSVPSNVLPNGEFDLALLQEKLGIANHKRAWVSAVGGNKTSIAGPPSVLNSVTDHLQSVNTSDILPSLRRLPIYAPYHSRKLVSAPQIASLLENLDHLPVVDLDYTDLQLKHLVGVGKDYRAGCKKDHDVFGRMLTSIFTDTVRWEDLQLECISEIKKDDVRKPCEVLVFGPELQAKLFTNGLRRLGSIDCSLNTDFSKPCARPNAERCVPLAVIGMSGRFPAAQNTRELWNVLAQGLDTVRELPQDRFDEADGLKNIKNMWGCFLDQPGMFDPRFFHMSPREALNTDPAQRIGLTTTQEAMDMAGFVSNVHPHSHKVGTFWGNATDDYKEKYMSGNVDAYYIPGSIRAFGPGRINFLFGFEGPAISYDTACSSSMVALDHACASLRNGDCDTAIVIGSNILSAPYNYQGLDLAHFLSRTGQCKTFDEHADGYCRGEAVATVLIKRLPDALENDDHILGTIRSIATSHSTLSGAITRPDRIAQEKLFRRILRNADLEPDAVSYVESHGTGTQVGDAVEGGALKTVFGRRTDNNPLYIGSVKSNLGHSEGASGVVSLIKTLLMFQEQKIPPHIGVKSGTRRRVLDLESHNFRLVDCLEDWKISSELEDGRRRALVNNFSAAGGITSMIIEEPPPRPKIVPPDSSPSETKRTAVVTVSGKTSKGLRANMQSLLNWMIGQPAANVHDIAYTTTVRRQHYRFRHAFVVTDKKDLEDKLRSALQTTSAEQQSTNIKIAFSGFTNMHPPAVKELFETSNSFRDEILELERSLERLGYPSVVPYFTTENAQLLTFLEKQLGFVAMQIAMYRLVKSWGITVSSIIGHSLGELVALHAAGMISVEGLFYIIGVRATTIETKCANTHGMLAIRSSYEGLQLLNLDELGIEISCHNSPTDTVVSGSLAALEQLKTRLLERNIRFSQVDTPYAFHSSQMDVLGDDLIKLQCSVSFTNPTTPLLSPALARAITSRDDVPPDYLKLQTRGAVNFVSALGTSEPTENQSFWIEIGPHAILTPLIKTNSGSSQAQAFPIMRRDSGIWSTTAKIASSLYVSGHDVDWKSYLGNDLDLRLVPELPPYSFDEQHYWLPRPENLAVQTKTQLNSGMNLIRNPHTTPIELPFKSLHRLISRVEYDGYLLLSFETNLRPLYKVAQGHMINGTYLCPAGMYSEIAFCVGQYLRENGLQLPTDYQACIAQLKIHKTIVLPNDYSKEFPMVRIVSSTALHDKLTTLRFETSGPENAQIHAQCHVRFERQGEWAAEWQIARQSVLESMTRLEVTLMHGRSQKFLSKLAYRLFNRVVEYDDNYKSMQEVITDESYLEGTASVTLRDNEDSRGYICSPFWMDGTVHLAGLLLNGLRGIDDDIHVYIASGWANYRLGKPIDPNVKYTSYVKLEDRGKIVMASCYVLQDAHIVAKLDGLEFHKMPLSILHRVLPRPGGPKISDLQSTPTNIGAQHKKGSSSVKSSMSMDAVVFTPRTEDELSDRGDVPRKMGLKQLLHDETGFTEDEIQNDTTLIDLGIDSMLAFTVSDRLCQEYDLDYLPADWALQYPTYGALEGFLKGKQDGRKSPRYESIATDLKSNPAPHTTNTAPGPSNGNDTPEKLRAIAARHLGIPVSEISMTEDLSSLGLDSLMSFGVIDDIRSTFKIELDYDIFTSAKTLQQVHGLLNETADEEVCVPQTNGNSTSATQRSRTLMSTLQGSPDATSKRLFLFPDGSGSAGVFSNLPAIDPSICVLALNSPFLRKGVISDATIEQLAVIWVDELQSYQAKGPYLLASYSSGGYHAYEATKILQKRGHSVEALVIIDTPSRTMYDAFPADSLDLLASTMDVTGDGSRKLPAWHRDHFQTSLAQIARYKPVAMPDDHQPPTYLILASQGMPELEKAFRKHDSELSPIQRFFASERQRPHAHGWDALIDPGHIRVAEVKGSHHFSIMHRQNAQEVGRLLRAVVLGQEGGFRALEG